MVEGESAKLTLPEVTEVSDHTSMTLTGPEVELEPRLHCEASCR